MANKGLLTYEEIIELIRHGVVRHTQLEHVNGSSLDVTLGPELLVEHCCSGTLPVVDYSKRQPLPLAGYSMDATGYILSPGEFILAHTVQEFYLPRDITATYTLKSSMARIGLESLNAGHADPGWRGSALTLELTNCARYARLQLRPGDRIGQVLFWRHAEVPCEHSYAVRGRYNGDRQVSGMKP